MEEGCIHETQVHRKLPVPHACTPAYRFSPLHICLTILGPHKLSIPLAYCPQHSSDNPHGYQHPTHHHDLQAESCPSSPEEKRYQSILSLGSSQTQTFKPCHFPGSPVDPHIALHKASATEQKHPPLLLLPRLQEISNFSLGASELGAVRTRAPAQYTQSPRFHPEDHDRHTVLSLAVKSQR